MEKIMSKTNDVSTLDHRPLADSELDAVSGGDVPLATLISTMLRDLHDTRAAIINNLKG
jgi:hypothetical protein